MKFSNIFFVVFQNLALNSAFTLQMAWLGFFLYEFSLLLCRGVLLSCTVTRDLLKDARFTDRATAPRQNLAILIKTVRVEPGRLRRKEERLHRRHRLRRQRRRRCRCRTCRRSRTSKRWWSGSRAEPIPELGTDSNLWAATSGQLERLPPEKTLLKMNQI